MKPITVPMNGETGCSVGPNGRLQTRRIKAWLNHCFPLATIIFSPNHYCCSAFVRLKDKVVHLMVSDYRFFPGHFIVREAKDEKDYTGGANRFFIGYEKIPQAIAKMLDYQFASPNVANEEGLERNLQPFLFCT